MTNYVTNCGWYSLHDSLVVVTGEISVIDKLLQISSNGSEINIYLPY